MRRRPTRQVPFDAPPCWAGAAMDRFWAGIRRRGGMEQLTIYSGYSREDRDSLASYSLDRGEEVWVADMPAGSRSRNPDRRFRG